MSSDFFQSAQYFGILWLLLQFVDLRPRDLAVLIHNEHGAVIHERYLMLGRREYAVSFRRFGIRPSVGRQRELQTSQGFLKGDVRENCIGIDAHDLGVQAGKLGEVHLNCRQFILSNRSEIESIETDHNIFPAIT
jgi:hypothetical protein